MTTEEERALIAEIVQLPLAPVVMRGFTAKRRTAHFGHVYGYETGPLAPGAAGGVSAAAPGGGRRRSGPSIRRRSAKRC
jgi:hypothetical protein